MHKKDQKDAGEPRPPDENEAICYNPTRFRSSKLRAPITATRWYPSPKNAGHLHVKFTGADLGRVLYYASTAVTSGPGHIAFEGHPRAAHRRPDQITGQLGEAALSLITCGSLAPYFATRELRNQNPHVHDGGQDLDGHAVDAKGRLMRGRAFEGHDLWVPVHSYARLWTYVLVVVWALREDVGAILGVAGYTTTDHLEPPTDAPPTPERPWTDRYWLPQRRLFDMSTFSLDVIRRVLVGAPSRVHEAEPRRWRPTAPWTPATLSTRALMEEFGATRVDAVYDAYGAAPTLFLVAGARGLYLVIGLDDSGVNVTSPRLYVRVSTERRAELELGLIDLHDACVRAEDGHVWRVREILPGQPIEATRVPCADLRAPDVPRHALKLTGGSAERWRHLVVQPSTELGRPNYLSSEVFQRRSPRTASWP